ncbi:MAG: DNA mismatch repair endonuclease MutL [Clostridia bacterium]|nr:DNA mismatch repair endonuclease MutL [Clostridia bacterium]
MAKINVLTPDVFNKIAAGEVVERPASIIKELVENSIDSGASFITIEVYGGGIEKIVVTDNGCGIEKEDLQKAFLPHATSKIKTADDINSILTLGFRGEALASIAAISNVCLTSRVKDSELGATISLKGGLILGVQDVGAPVGTKTQVENIFFNVPARAKFLKKPKQEEQEITNLVSRFILANPNISFRYLADGKQIYQTSGNGEEDALFAVYGKDAITETIKINHEQYGIKIHGVIGKPSFSKPNRTYQTLVLNGRYISAYQVSLSVQEAYNEKLMKRQYPFYVLYIDMPADSVDVNVHPNKMEVRFLSSSSVFGVVFNACSKAIDSLDEVTKAYLDESNQKISATNNASLIGGQTLNNTSNFLNGPYNSETSNIFKEQPFNFAPNESENNSDIPNSLLKQGFNNTDNIEVNEDVSLISAITKINKDENDGVHDGFGLGSILLDSLNQEKSAQEKPKQEAMGIKPELRKIGKFFNTYLLLEDGENLFIIDQHAAHERLMYEKFKSSIENGSVAVQPLLVPYVLNLNASEIEIFERNKDAMISLGFGVEPFGENSYKISAIPSIVCDLNFDEFFSEFLSEAKRNKELTKLDLIRDHIMQLSCKSAVKGGWDLSQSEIDSLYNSLSKEKVALFCPHGRPLVIRITKHEVEKWFKRIV